MTMPDPTPTNAQLAEAVRRLAAEAGIASMIDHYLAPKPEPESNDIARISTSAYSHIPDDFLPPGMPPATLVCEHGRDHVWRSYLRAVREGRV